MSFAYVIVDDELWGETMKKVVQSYLSGDFVEGRIREAFKKNKYCQSFELNCKFPRQAYQFYDYSSKKIALKAQMKEDLRQQICEHFDVESIDQVPCCEVEQLERFIHKEYCPSVRVLKEIYNLSLFYDSIRLREELKLDESTVKSKYKRELTVSEDLRRIVDDEIHLD